MSTGRLLLPVILTGFIWSTIDMTHAAERPGKPPSRERAQKLFKDGNFNDAYQAYRRLSLDPDDDPRQVTQDLDMATQCLQQLNRVAEIDEFREAVIATHTGNWRLLAGAAQNYMNVPHHGFMVAGKFQRGNKRGGGQMVSADERDRVRALQLMVQAMPLALEDDDHISVANFMLSMARMFLNNRGYGEAWRLQYLTDLDELPDYDDAGRFNRFGYRGQATAAPVDEEGNPVYHHAPKSFKAAETDGERWRWCLEEAIELDPPRADQARLEFAGFLANQFSVSTMAQFGYHFWRMEPDDSKEDESGTYALHTLSEDETIARLATGVKRFKLPDEFNFIRIYQQVSSKPKIGYAENALVALAQIFENRRQYPKAADYWRKRLAISPADHYRKRLEQIVDNWGRFEPIMTQPAEKGATVEYRFRNGTQARFTAQRIDVPKLLDDVKAYLKSRPTQIDRNKINIGNIGYRLVNNEEERYLLGEVAAWTLGLKPREDHLDRRITVTTPLTEPGAYLLKAQMEDGNTSHIIIWLADTAIAKKPLDQKTLYYVADAVSGKPIAKANLEFFGFKQERRQNRRYEISTKQFAEFTDADGMVMLDSREQPTNHQWIITARTKQGRFAYLGFTGVWYGRRHDAEYNQTKVFSITDRPVYRPEQTVHYKLWMRHAKYDLEDTSDFAEQACTIEIHDPKGERIVEKQVTLDEYGGIEGNLELPTDATLGVYRLDIKGFGGGSFRVEEYKKPEFEVTVDAPTDPVMLGEKIEAKITAKYYFGSPVTNAKVKYKITRTDHTERWYPVGPWDWLYGRGYWWFGYDYHWYPGFHTWGCLRPIPFWWHPPSAPPEIVAEREVEIGPDGTVKVEIDTGLAKAIHPDKDHSYSITAEVVDESRRTIVGSGNVLVARKPFKVHAWLDRGYYRVGDTILASFSARTLDGKPVQGTGVVTLLEISYKDGKPVETPVRDWESATNQEGRSKLQLKAARSGQYRVSYKLTDAAEHTIEGGYVFAITGSGFDGSDFRFNNIELLPDKAEYQPGETVKLMVNTDRTGGTVLLFVRPSNGIYLPPKIVRLDGKSSVQEIAVVKKDMPNFFVEAVTVAGGKVHTETKEIVVPPEKRVLTVDVTPSSETYKPGQKAKVRIKLTDFHGEPFVGSTVVAIYDKSVEYISGGSNVPEIKEFFWKWRRHHNPRTETNLQRRFNNLVRSGVQGMNDVGVFGATVVDDLDGLEFDESGPMGMEGQVRRGVTAFGGGMAGGPMLAKGMRVPMAPSAAAAPMQMAMEAAPADAMMDSESLGRASNEAKPAGAEMVEPTVRSNFADTALWVGVLTTENDGTAEVALEMPENLTTWRIKVWGMGHGTKVGQGQTDVVTRKDLILRMQAPRFFVEKDEVVLSANVHNYLDDAKTVRVALELDGDELQALGELVQTVKIDPEDEARIDWRVKVAKEGEAVIRMKALTDEESDAMEMTFPSYVHGMLKMDSVSGALRPKDKSGKFTITVPSERRPDQSRLEVRYSPTLAGAMVDALPYLVEYPYGCTEQTLSRFLPTVITQRILTDMGLDLDDIREKRTNLNAQEIGDDTERAKRWKRYERNPVFDEAEVRRMVKDGVTRLTEMQLTDGGWGWFSGYHERSTPHTTAYVVHGLQIAQQNDVALVPGILERGVAWLVKYQDEQIRRIKNAKKDPKERPWKEYADNLDAFVYMVLVDAKVKNAEMLEFLYRDRTHLAAYGLAMYGIALEEQDETKKLAMVMRNIGQYVMEDEENQTAWLNLPGGYWWYWYGSEYEAHAYYLKLLARTDPKGKLAPRLVKYLLNNRKHATYWNSTRDTAICIEAMAEFLKASGEDKPQMTVQILLDGKLQKEVEITPENLFQFDNKFVLEGDAVTDGEHTVQLKKSGTGPLYYNGYLTNFTLEDYITRAGLEIKVNRKYYRLNPVDKEIKAAGSRGQVVDQKVEKYEREELADLSVLKSGDLVEIELEIDSKNDYEYLVFEDMKPAGFEPVDLRSGYNGNALGAYMEFRDNRVVMFKQRLARGKHSVAYRMRAEIPGRFSALPTRAWAMYAPELKANSDEIKLRVED